MGLPSAVHLCRTCYSSRSAMSPDERLRQKLRVVFGSGASYHLVAVGLAGPLGLTLCGRHVIRIGGRRLRLR